MTILDIILSTGFGLGFLLMFCGVIVSNVATQKMRAVLNSSRSSADQFGWSDAVQRVAQGVIDGYRTSHPNGPLYRHLVLGYWLAGIGGVVGLGSAFALKVVH